MIKLSMNKLPNLYQKCKFKKQDFILDIQKAGITDKPDEILFGNFTNFSIIKMA